MTRFLQMSFVLMCVFTAVCGTRVYGVDFWVRGTDASVVTNNDCGRVSAIHGQPVVVRSFQEEGSAGHAILATDRVYSGDELRIPDGGRLELTSGSNVVISFGSGSRVRFSGLRSFSAGVEREASRLDLELLSGELRVQVRQNQVRPESVLVSSGGGDFLIRRGDVCVLNSSVWRGWVLAGEAMARQRRGTSVGAPFVVHGGNGVGEGGALPLDKELGEQLRTRLPFSFDITRAALPPLPSLSYDEEAP